MNLKNCSPGLDSICCHHIKYIVDNISEAFCHIVNLIFKASVFPNDMKRSKIIPVYKKGDMNLSANYRPISTMPCFRKVEKLNKKGLSNFLDKFKLLTPRQFSFRCGYSTDLALIPLTDNIKAEID